MAEILKGTAHIKDAADLMLVELNELKKKHGVTPEQAAEIDKSAAELQTKLTELNDVRNNYQ